jgi:hypothetical protein
LYRARPEYSRENQSDGLYWNSQVLVRRVIIAAAWNGWLRAGVSVYAGRAAEDVAGRREGTMGDGAEGLVDAQARIQDRLDELEQRRAPRGRIVKNPEREQRLQSLRLARTELERQARATEHPVRREQLAQAIAEIDRRIASLPGQTD